MNCECIKLNNGSKVPALGLGTFRVSSLDAFLLDCQSMSFDVLLLFSLKVNR